jgi:peptide-methionine (S)-S-oxide reductase
MKPTPTHTETAVLAGGCFWCLEAAYQMVRGVSTVTSGYAGGQAASPTYDSVSTGTTGHAESVRV